MPHEPATGEAHVLSPADRQRIARRRFLMTVGWGGLSALLVATVPALIRFLWPQSRRDRREVVEVGTLQDYRAVTVATRWVHRDGLWIVNQDGRLFAIEARCTHLGCTPRWIPEWGVFRCPCHGSRFSPDGVALNGPASLPLNRLAIRIERGLVVVDRSVRAPLEQAERDQRFFIRV